MSCGLLRADAGTLNPVLGGISGPTEGQRRRIRDEIEFFVGTMPGASQFDTWRRGEFVVVEVSSLESAILIDCFPGSPIP